MSNLQQTEQQANAPRREEMSRLAGKFFTWLSTELRSRHEASLRRRNQNVRLRPVNATPV